MDKNLLVLVFLGAGAVVSIFRVNWGLALIGFGLFLSKAL